MTIVIQYAINPYKLLEIKSNNQNWYVYSSYSMTFAQSNYKYCFLHFKLFMLGTVNLSKK